MGTNSIPRGVDPEDYTCRIEALRCSCRAISKRIEKGDVGHTVILVANGYQGEIRKKIVGALPIGAKCTGVVWHTGSTTFSVMGYSEHSQPHRYKSGPFFLQVCSGGKVMNNQDRYDIQKWRDTQALHAKGF